jgi:hypothetical protein
MKTYAKIYSNLPAVISAAASVVTVAYLHLCWSTAQLVKSAGKRRLDLAKVDVPDRSDTIWHTPIALARPSVRSRETTKLIR